jgi:hypothetical protein
MEDTILGMLSSRSRSTIFERLKWQVRTLLVMLTLPHKGGRWEHLWACSVFSNMF